MYGQQIFNKVTRSIQWGKNSFFNQWCLDNWICTCKRMKLHSYLGYIPTIYKDKLKQAVGTTCNM